MDSLPLKDFSLSKEEVGTKLELFLMKLFISFIFQDLLPIQMLGNFIFSCIMVGEDINLKSIVKSMMMVVVISFFKIAIFI